MILKIRLIFNFVIVLTTSVIYAQNPFITEIYTADPSARVFNGKLYVYSSHDADYHMFSTDDLVNWTNHGVVLSHNTVPWVKDNSYGMWAPDCIDKNGVYYFYFPAIPKDGSRFRRIGVATSNSPTGPFTSE